MLPDSSTVSHVTHDKSSRGEGSYGIYLMYCIYTNLYWHTNSMAWRVHDHDASKRESKWNSPSDPFCVTPTSVAIPSISAAGVTSNAGFQTSIPSAAMHTVSIVLMLEEREIVGPRIRVTSAAGRSSMMISSPDLVRRSMDVRGAATRNLTL